MKKTILLLSLALAFLAACSYTQKVRDGKTAYERMQFDVATKMLQKEFKKANSRVEKGKIAYLIGDSYRRLNKDENSINWFKIAYDNQYGVDALKEYAYGLKATEQYQEAKIAFKELGIEIGSPYEYRREINACDIALGWKELKYPEYRVGLLQFNSGSSDYSPSLYKENQLVFTSDRSTSTGDDEYKWTGNDFSDLFVVDLSSNAVSSFDDRINTVENEGTVAFSKNYDEVFFTRCFGGKKEDAYCKLMVSNYQSGTWTLARVLPFVENNVNYLHPALSEDGSKLYFSSNHPDGWGGYDIYVVERIGISDWGEPKLMSRSINTIGNEKFPTLDGDTLYFASDFLPGMGGLDIFKTYPFNGNWAPAFNLRPPVNSGGDDFGYIVDRQGSKGQGVVQVGYFTSTRAQGAGSDDIYSFEKIIPPPEPELEEPEVVEYKMILDVYILEKIYEDPTDPNSKVLGRRPLDGADVEVMIGKTKKSVTVREDGLFSVNLKENTSYSFLASKEQYLTNDGKFESRGIGKDPRNPVQRFEMEIVLDRIFKDKEIVLENIYYDFDKWNIRKDAEPTLNELAGNLELNPKIKIQMSSHTDCRGNAGYNKNLSQKRAQSAVDYLISKGIGSDRLVAKGYGEDALEVECICTRCTEEEHQSNRRTTFKIIE